MCSARNDSATRSRRPPVPRESATDERRWAAVVARDASADGTFVYSVDSTGVYCRPSCPSRQARRDRVRFHDSVADAVTAGFRPCKRCRPDDASLGARHARLVADACRQIETAEDPPTLAELAATAGLSPHHFHRVFKQIAGVTAKAYASAHRQRRIRDTLARARSVTEALHDAGFGSASRFYADSGAALGMTPTQYRDGGRGASMRYAVADCSLGTVLVAASAKGLTAILLGDEASALLADLAARFPAADLAAASRDFDAIVAEVVALIETPKQTHDLPLDIRGTAFQARVWQAMRHIPPGATVSYAELARAIGAPGSARAVARACAGNSLAVAVPCHRVVRGDGGLCGYRWGVQRKRTLLERESEPVSERRKAGRRRKPD